MRPQNEDRPPEVNGAETPAQAGASETPPMGCKENNEKQQKQKKRKKEKQPFVDDGHPIVNMDVDGFPWHGRAERKKKQQNLADRPTFKEKLAIILGVYRAFLPALLIMCGALALMFLLGYFWLH